MQSGALAADMEPVAPVPTLWRNAWDLRVGGFAHAIGSVEQGGGDIGVQLVLPSLFSDPQSWWQLLVPRPYIGAMASIPHRSDSVRGGALWRFPLWGRFFTEAFFGGAYDNGSINGDATHNALGSRWLFNAGGSLGYHIDEHWSVMVTFDHMSNGKTVFGTGFEHNEGVNDLGLQISYRF
jgi:hypothetical protein